MVSYEIFKKYGERIKLRKWREKKKKKERERKIEENKGNPKVLYNI